MRILYKMTEMSDLCYLRKSWISWEPLAPAALITSFYDKYGIPTNQWTWLYEALLEVSMTKIALWIRICADDWAAKRAIKASNERIELNVKACYGFERIKCGIQTSLVCETPI